MNQYKRPHTRASASVSSPQQANITTQLEESFCTPNMSDGCKLPESSVVVGYTPQPIASSDLDFDIAFLAEQLPILPPADDATFTPLPNVSSSVADANGCTTTPRSGPGGTEMKVTNSSAFEDFDLTTFLDEHTLQLSGIEMDDESIAFLAEQLPILPPADDATFTPLPNISSSVADADGCTATPHSGPGGTEMKVSNSSALEDFDLTDEHTLQVSDIEWTMRA